MNDSSRRFTAGFVDPDLAARMGDAWKEWKRKRQAMAKKRAATLEKRYGSLNPYSATTMPMFISDWFIDTDGCPTRIIHQLDHPWTHQQSDLA